MQEGSAEFAAYNNSIVMQLLAGSCVDRHWYCVKTEYEERVKQSLVCVRVGVGACAHVFVADLTTLTICRCLPLLQMRWVATASR